MERIRRMRDAAPAEYLRLYKEERDARATEVAEQMRESQYETHLKNGTCPDSILFMTPIPRKAVAVWVRVLNKTTISEFDMKLYAQDIENRIAKLRTMQAEK